MLEREACERRVYRLAVLLAGNPLSATRIITQVIHAQPDLGQLDGAHMDRLTVLRSREIAAPLPAGASSLVSDLVPQAVSDALAALRPQQREAYVLARVYRSLPRETARAMDCSTQAADRHLQSADAGMLDALGDRAGGAPRALLAYSMSLDVPAFYRARQLRRRRLRRALAAAGIVLLAAAAAGLVIWWSRPFEGGAGH